MVSSQTGTKTESYLELRTISENKVKAIDRDDPISSHREKQDEDTDVSLMKNWVKESTIPDFSKIKGRGYVLQSLWSQSEIG